MRTIRSFLALMWLRWRLLRNSLAGSRRRDAVEQMSRALAMAAPLIVMTLSLGTFLAVSIVSFIGGRMMGSGLVAPAAGLLVVRLMLGIMVFAVVALTVVSPTQSTLAKYTRLLLLPIPRRALHLVEVAASVADPWIAVIAAGLTTFAAGLYWGGRPGVAAAALGAALATFVVIVCAGALASFLVAWLMRDRRRGELFTLLFVVAFSLASLLPALFSQSERTEGRRRGEIDVAELDRSLPAWSRYLPSELHGRAVAAGFDRDRGGVMAAIGALGVEAVFLFWASSRVHARMLNSLEGDQSRRRAKTITFGIWSIPFLTTGSSAVAWSVARGTLRTVRGRLMILLPGPMLAMLTAVFKGLPQQTLSTEAAARGYLLFGASLIFMFYAIHAVSMNFFGSDRAGLTMQLLAPISDRELAWGKVAGFGAIASVSTAVCLAAALLVARSGSPAYWIAVLCGGVAIFCLIAPIALWFSALFPVASDLSKTGAGGNPHPLPMMLGTLITAILALPTVAILAIAEFYLESPSASIVLSVVWMAIAAAIGLPLVNVAARAIGQRRENLALVAQGR
jgi:hypothetical protein